VGGLLALFLLLRLVFFLVLVRLFGFVFVGVALGVVRGRIGRGRIGYGREGVAGKHVWSVICFLYRDSHSSLRLYSTTIPFVNIMHSMKPCCRVGSMPGWSVAHVGVVYSTPPSIPFVTSWDISWWLAMAAVDGVET
jgi:hypothetical protein